MCHLRLGLMMVMVAGSMPVFAQDDVSSNETLVLEEIIVNFRGRILRHDHLSVHSRAGKTVKAKTVFTNPVSK